MYIALLVLAYVATLGCGELFSSMAHLQAALYAERDIAQEIRTYMDQEHEKLDQLKKIADEFESHSTMALENPDLYLGNPVTAYLFVKHFTLDWDRDIDQRLRNNSRDELLQKVDELKQHLPTYEDLSGSVTALLRLQDTYRLETSDIARGDVGGVKTTELTADDCFEFGRLAYNEEDYYHTILWMEESLARNMRTNNRSVSRIDILDFMAFSYYKVGRQAYLGMDFYHTIMWMQESAERNQLEMNKTMDDVTILDYLTFAMFKQGNVRRALTLTDELLTLDPDHERAMNNKRYYQKLIAEEDKNSMKRGDDADLPLRNKRQLDEYRQTNEFRSYEALCRGEDIMKVKNANRLTCQYRSNNHPLLILCPAKEEVMHTKPFLAVYHNIITDDEMNMIKSLAIPKLDRATVHNVKTGKLETAAYRVSKSCWLKDNDDLIIERVNNRVQALTGLLMATAEELQVSNYGLGGHYEPHFDFARRRVPTPFERKFGNRIAMFMYCKEEPDAFKSLGTGNRIATFMYYMSDVQAGGATVFPYLGLKIFPEKGSAVFWYNLYRSGEGIYDTRHAACPVLVGSKWVANKWIHEVGQEFRRPCGLAADE